VAELLSSVKNSKWLLSAILNYFVVMVDHPRSKKKGKWLPIL